MKHALLLVGVFIFNSATYAQTGSAADFQKVSSLEGGLEGPLNNGGKFGYVCESKNPNVIFSGAPLSGNGEFFIVALDEDGSVLSEERISADDFAYFEGIENAEFGASVVDLGDTNGDNKSELVVGAPGIEGGKLFGLTSQEGSYSLEPLVLPGEISAVSQRLGEYLYLFQDELYTASAHGEGSVYRLGIDPENGLSLLETIDASHSMLENRLEQGDRFGSGLSVADVNGDGIADILCGAPGDDDQDTNFGAVYLLHRNGAGEISDVLKISRLEGDFGGFLNVDDEFGISVRSIGDLDQNGVTDLAVGAPGDDDGGTDIGSVWILFRHPEGWVINERKINRFEGNFTINLGSDDRLAGRIATIGDRNGDGTTDLVASVSGDDDGGPDRGGFYTIFLEYCPAPSGDFDYEVEGPTVQFFAEGGQGYSYIWNFDDGGYSEQQNPVHTYENTGTYTVCLAINNECGGDNFCKNVQVTSVLNATDSEEPAFKLYPNPASERIFFSGLSSEALLRITDITGKVVFTGRTLREGIDVAHLNEGLYLVEIVGSGNRMIKKLKVVK
jgi:hypothetical protein